MKRCTLYIVCSILAIVATFAQDDRHNVQPYHRNAMAQMLIYNIDDEFGYEVYKIFMGLPALDKFDNHNISMRIIDNQKVTGVIGGGEKGLYHKDGSSENLELSPAEKSKNAQAILSMLNKAQVGKHMVAKWFDLKGKNAEDATFSSKLLDERTSYNVTISEAELARYTVEGVNVAAAASEEMIENTFLLVTEMTYRTAEARADAAKVALGVIGGIFDGLTGKNYGERAAELAGDIADSYTGFKVKTQSYLYQLVWNDSIANIFYDKYYTETPNPAKINDFIADKSSFKMKYIGCSDAKAEKTEKKGNYGRTELLRFISQRSIDKNIANLQSTYPEFRIKTPIVAVEYDNKGKLMGYRALVGQKEGVTETRQYEVLEMKVSANGKVTYTQVAKIKPIPNQIWDNRFDALMENDFDVAVEGTLFKVVTNGSGKQIVPGMLIREL